MNPISHKGDRRHSKRLPIDTEGWIEVEDAERIPVLIKNMSLRGACILNVPPDRQISRQLRVAIQHPESPPVIIPGRLIWRDADRLGVEFVAGSQPA